MNTEDYDWLGIVYPNDVRQNVALITPLAFYDEGEWHATSHNENIHYFPNNGKAAVFKGFPTSKIGWLYSFWPEYNPSLHNPENLRHSHYQVNSEELEIAPLVQILDWTARANHTFDLPTFLDQGIQMEDCICQQVYIRYQKYLYGPIRLELDFHTKRLRLREYVQSSSTGGQSLLVFMYTMPEDGILLLGDAPYQFSVFYEDILEAPMQQEDWSQPQVVIKRVLKASNEVLPNLEKDVRLVDRRVSELARLSSPNGPSAIHIEQATLKRAQHIVSNQKEHLQDLHTLLEQLPAEHPLLTTAREQEIKLRSDEIYREAETRTQEQQARLQELEDKIQGAEVMLSELQDAARAAEALQKQALAVEHEVQQRLVKLREEPLHVLAELQIAASLFPILQQNGHRTDEPLIQPAYSTSPVPSSDQSQLVDSSARKHGFTWMPDTNTQAMNNDLYKLPRNFWLQFAQGIQSKDISICIAALVCGFIPVVKGPAALSLARVVAQAIASGRVWSVPVSLTALTPLDLFGTIDLERRMFIPSAGGLADIILHAQKHPQELALVLLDGVDRVPGMAVYVPLLRQYIEVRQAGNHLMQPQLLNLFHPRALAPDDPYLELAWLTWPSNLLLAVTCDSDINSLPLPPICAPWFVQLKAKPAKVKQSTATSSHVPLDLWKRWEKEISHEVVDNTEYQEAFDQRQQIFYQALKLLTVPNPDDVIKQVWPQQFGEDEDRDTQEAY